LISATPSQQNSGAGYKEIDVTRYLGAGLSPAAATAQSYWLSDGRTPVHAIDGSGMTPSYWLTAAATAGTLPSFAMWLSNGTKETWITFDLGSVQIVSGFHLWNYNEYSNKSTKYAGRGIKTADLYVGDSLLTNGSVYASAGAAWGTLVTNMTFAQATASSSYTGEDYALATPVTGRYFQLYVTDNYGLDDYTGISEILFYRLVSDTEVTRLSSGLKVIPTAPRTTSASLMAKACPVRLRLKLRQPRLIRSP
jgi:hypothetical protein